MLLDDEKFRIQVKKDISWSKENFDQECIDFVVTKQRYVDLISKRIILLKNKEEELNKMYKKRYDYYKNYYNVVLNDKEAKSYTEADDEYLKVKREYNEIECDMNYLKGTLENISQKYWMMKLWKEYQEFISGER